MTKEMQAWAESLETADLCNVTMDYSDGKSITVEVIVFTNRVKKQQIIGWYKDKAYYIPYNQLRPKE